MSISRQPCNSQIVLKELNLKQVIKLILTSKADLLFVCEDNKRLIAVIS